MAQLGLLRTRNVAPPHALQAEAGGNRAVHAPGGADGRELQGHHPEARPRRVPAAVPQRAAALTATTCPGAVLQERRHSLPAGMPVMGRSTEVRDPVRHTALCCRRQRLIGDVRMAVNGHHQSYQWWLLPYVLESMQDFSRRAGIGQPRACTRSDDRVTSKTISRCDYGRHAERGEFPSCSRTEVSNNY